MLRCTAHAAVRGLFHRAYEPVSSTADSPSMAPYLCFSKSWRPNESEPGVFYTHGRFRARKRCRFDIKLIKSI